MESSNSTPARLSTALIILYTLSGVTALGYQVLWARMFSMHFGVSIFGVAVTAAAFMFGLGGGSIFGARLAPRIKNPLSLFAVVEIAIAGYALVLPELRHALDTVLDAQGDIRSWYAWQGLSALLLITVPTTAMGIAFPLVLRAGARYGRSLAALYGANTLGGACGALLPLALLPLFGWQMALWTYATLGVALGLGAWIVATRWDRAAVPGDDAHIAVELPPRQTSIPWKLLGAYAGIGFAALALEVAWVRLYGMLLLRTEYVLAVILAVYLAGVGLGSLLATRDAVRRYANALPAVAALAAIGGVWALPQLAAWADGAEFGSLGEALIAQGLAITILTLPVTLILGAWLPLLAGKLGSRSHFGALLYGANSLGAALGAILSAAVLVNVLGTAAVVLMAALMLFAFGMTWAENRKWWLAGPILLLAAWPVASLPTVDRLLPVTQAGTQTLFSTEDALAITHVVEQPDGNRLLLADLQRMDASSEPSAVVAQRNQVILPLLLHPQPRSALLLGLGTGISASGAGAFDLERLVAVEISQGAIDAATRYFSAVNAGITGKLEIVRDDARRFLKADTAAYDVIVGDLFHPDLVGRSTLLSLQQFERARQRLADGGVFVQWLALNQFEPQTLLVIMRTFEKVFPQGVMFVDGFRLALVGANAPDLDVRHVLASPPDQFSQEDVWTWMGRYWGRIRAGDGPVEDEWWPRIEYALPRARYRGDVDIGVTLGWMVKRRPLLPVAARELRVAEQGQAEAFERAYVATELAARSWVAAFQGISDESVRLLRLAYQANPRDRWITYQLADRMFESLPAAVTAGIDEVGALERILDMAPQHTGALLRLVELAREQEDAARLARYENALKTVNPLARID